MRNLNVSLGAVFGSLVLMTTVLPAADTLVSYQWGFTTGANPAPAFEAAAEASVSPGDLASGWLADLPMLAGGAGGYWDLGKQGRIQLQFPQGLAGPGRTLTRVTVKVAQWWDGSIFGEFAAVEFPGAIAAEADVNVDQLGILGGWVVDETAWMPSAGAALDRLTVIANSGGGVIDSIVVEAEVAAFIPPQLSIKVAGNDQVELSWPEENTRMILQSSPDPADEASWKAVGGEVAVAEGRATIVLPAEGPVRFYRLMQP